MFVRAQASARLGNVLVFLVRTWGKQEESPSEGLVSEPVKQAGQGKVHCVCSSVCSGGNLDEHGSGKLSHPETVNCYVGSCGGREMSSPKHHFISFMFRKYGLHASHGSRRADKTQISVNS